MPNVYFIVMDTSKYRDDEKQMRFFSCPYLNDLVGYLEQVSKTEGVPLSVLRLFVAPTKKVWERMRSEFWERVAGKE